MSYIIICACKESFNSLLFSLNNILNIYFVFIGLLSQIDITENNEKVTFNHLKHKYMAHNNNKAFYLGTESVRSKHRVS